MNCGILAPTENATSDPDWIRTNDPQLRRLMLYPTELPDRFIKLFTELPKVFFWRCKLIKKPGTMLIIYP